MPGPAVTRIFCHLARASVRVPVADRGCPAGQGADEAVNQVSATIAFGPGAEAGVYRALYWASVSNPASPFVDMVSGAQGTAAN
jgi:hypothetical protein